MGWSRNSSNSLTFYSFVSWSITAIWCSACTLLINANVSLDTVFYSVPNRSESRVALVVSATSCVKVPVVNDTA